ncbi:hydroxymethylglutaryl-CoA synthase [Loigolactobacillus iwatensis]|uniref:hydroxymethylglutaryl-CoA synthase n=1 Tax=Loigolactobacillus iwatensis TaxID=1267156 RepID=UPI000F7DFB86|nr:hydroxymethylglutaryl-CoA synthase [Loigolactobacillus iwatensis]
MKIGIDQLSFYTTNYFIDMAKLAKARNEDPNKYLIGIGQRKMAVIPPTQDSVTLAANAAAKLLTPEIRQQIDTIIFATESGIDQSKSGAVYLQRLLKLPKSVRAFEVKQACYSATAALQFARGFVALHPDKKVLVTASDIARYGLHTPGEPTQGGGAAAFIVSANPRILALEDTSTVMTEDVMDFWRPNYATEAMVDGHYSGNVYVDFFQDVFNRFKTQTGMTIANFQAFAFHLPYTKMGLKALRTILPEASEAQQEQLKANFEDSRGYNQDVGNLYTGSLYLSLLSLLENTTTLHSGDRIGLFSYGSGAVSEFFTGILQGNFKDALLKESERQALNKRQEVDLATYERLFNTQLPTNGSSVELDTAYEQATYYLAGIANHQRQYRVTTK